MDVRRLSGGGSLERSLAATAAAAASVAVCATVGALAVASTGAALAGEEMKLEIVPLNDL